MNQTLTFPTRRDGDRYLKARGFRYDWNRVTAWPFCVYRRTSDHAVAWLSPLCFKERSGIWEATVTE